ncbi:DUF63 family protein [Halobaculum sp. MBLA0143]|uniref:DUF63 family protein n=1 Tax=Halobaculum sp. MBLA0143 TaxID=3079933 RepID=UPI00352670F8
MFGLRPSVVPAQLLPEGFALPPTPYVVGSLLAVAGVAWGLSRRDLAFGEEHVLAAVPWMVVGAAGHVLFVVEAVPAVAAPLFGTPAVYVTAAVVGGAVWLAADVVGVSVVRTLAVVGSVTAVAAVGAVLVTAETVAATLPAGGLLSGVGLGWLAARLLARLRPETRVAGAAGTLAVVAHGVDGVTTAVGVDLLGFGERTPLSALILEASAALPTAATLGTGWLFVLVKLLVAAVAVALVAPTVAETDREGYALLAVVAAVGLGPGVHNALLFTVAA